MEPSDDKLLRIYRAEPTHRLEKLRWALTTERSACLSGSDGRTPAASGETIRFCERRLPLVEQVLHERVTRAATEPR